MKTNLNLITTLLIIPFFLQSCYSYKPLGQIQQTELGNLKAANVTGALVERNPSAFFYAMIFPLTFAMVIPGMIWMFSTDMEKRIMPLNEELFSKWEKSYNKRKKEKIIAIPQNKKYSSLILIPQNAEQTFTANNEYEVLFYYKHYPNSPYTDEFIKRSAPVCDDNGLKKIIELYPYYPSTIAVKKQMEIDKIMQK